MKRFFSAFRTFMRILFFQGLHLKNWEKLPGKKKKETLTETLSLVIHLKVLNSYSEPEI